MTGPTKLSRLEDLEGKEQKGGGRAQVVSKCPYNCQVSTNSKSKKEVSLGHVLQGCNPALELCCNFVLTLMLYLLISFPPLPPPPPDSNPLPEIQPELLKLDHKRQLTHATEKGEGQSCPGRRQGEELEKWRSVCTVHGRGGRWRGAQPLSNALSISPVVGVPPYLQKRWGGGILTHPAPTHTRTHPRCHPGSTPV